MSAVREREMNGQGAPPAAVASKLPGKGVRFIELPAKAAPPESSAEASKREIMLETLHQSDSSKCFTVENLNRRGLIELVYALYNQSAAWAGAFGALGDHYDAFLKQRGLQEEFPEFCLSAYQQRCIEDHAHPAIAMASKTPKPSSPRTTAPAKLPKWARQVEAEALQFDQECGITDDILTLDHLTPEGLRLFWAKRMQEEIKHKEWAQDSSDLLLDVLEANGLKAPAGVTRYRNNPGELLAKAGK